MDLSQFKISTDPQEMDYVWIVDTLKQTYWGSRYTRAMVFKACENSLCFSVYQKRSNDGLRQIGFARVVTDHAIFSSMQDVVVDADFRGKGIGTMLMHAVTTHPLVEKTINIIGTRYAEPFYARFGWGAAIGPILQRNPTAEL